MNGLVFVNLLIALAPVYLAWFFALSALFASFSLLALVPGTYLLAGLERIQRKIGAERLGEDREWAAIARLQELMRSRVENSPHVGEVEVCACVGGRGTNRRAVVHFRTAHSSWSYQDRAATNVAALARSFGKHQVEPVLRTPVRQCNRECAIAASCPNHTNSRDYREIFRFHVPARVGSVVGIG